MQKKSQHVAIVGASGAVGREFLDVLTRRGFPVASLRLLGSARSAGQTMEFAGEKLTVEPLTAQSFGGVDVALFSAGGSVAKEFAPVAVRAGAVVVDNSSAFRMDPDVPLVIPPINGADAAAHRGIIANPNCTTAVTLMALAPLHRAFGVKRVFASSYQAVSGTGARAIAELRRQVAALAAGQTAAAEIYPHQIAFNVLPQVDVFLPDGYTKEEMKMQGETRRILHLPEFRASVTCVRVPVYRAHSVAVSAEFARPASLEAARAALAVAPGPGGRGRSRGKPIPDAAAQRGPGRLRRRPPAAGLRAGQRAGLLGFRRPAPARGSAQRRRDCRTTLSEVGSRKNRGQVVYSAGGEPHALFLRRVRHSISPLPTSQFAFACQQQMLAAVSRSGKSCPPNPSLFGCLPSPLLPSGNRFRLSN